MLAHAGRLWLRRGCTRNITVRCFTTHTRKTFGIVFDIDGVIYRGKQLIPSAKEVVHKVAAQQVPFVFLTNGGGVKESVRASQLSKMLDIEIPPSNVILSHTPCQDLVPEYGNKLVLVSGGKDDECGAIAESYGFKKVVTVNQLSGQFPQLNPLLHYPSKTEIKPKPYEEPIAAVMVFHDPLNWYQDLQVLLDVAMSDGYIGTLSSKQKVKFIFTNPDIAYSSQFPLPRVAQGSFRICLQALFKQFTGRDLEYTELGKPHAIAYHYAEKVLREQAEKAGKHLDVIYGIGDNPHSDSIELKKEFSDKKERRALRIKTDIKGANAAGEKFYSILVRTGIFQSDGENDETHPAKKVVKDVGEALDFILEENKAN